MRIVTNPTPFILLLAMIPFIAPSKIEAYEVLYSEDFQDGVISEDWLFYGDPVSNINLEQGNPAPSFNNNGDSMHSSGIILKRSFAISDGIHLQVDNFLYCHPRGTWVSIEIGLFNPNLQQSLNADLPPVDFAQYKLAYSGELDWFAPHLETILLTNVVINERQMNHTIHANQLLNHWFTLTIELRPESCNFLIDDSLIETYPVTIPDSLTEVGIFIGGNATSWGTALIDNLVVYRP